MTKGKPCPALTALIDMNTIDIEANKWVERDLSEVPAIAGSSANPGGEQLSSGDSEKGLNRSKTP